jgi:hypothetical protein
LELAREKELESMFLQLLGEGGEQASRKRRRKKRADAADAEPGLAPAPAPDQAAPPSKEPS